MIRSIVMVLAAAACAACGDGATAPSPSIEGQTWRLVSLQRGTQIVTVASPDRYTVRFEDGRAAVRSDCNSCGGSYSLDAAELRVASLACTRAFCGPDSLDAEFTRALEGAASVLASGDTLVLHGGEATLRLSR